MRGEESARSRGNLLRAILSRDHVCPWWLAYSFDNRLRQWIHRPERLLRPYVRPGMTVVDIGCGMGYFSLALARMVGSSGRVIAVDLQPEMLKVASSRLEREGLAERVHLHLCREENLGLEAAADFVLTFWVAHEVGRLASFMGEIHSLLEGDGTYFLAEPILHVSAAKFRSISEAAIGAGFQVREAPAVRLSRALVFGKVSEGEGP